MKKSVLPWISLSLVVLSTTAFATTEDMSDLLPADELQATLNPDELVADDDEAAVSETDQVQDDEATSEEDEQAIESFSGDSESLTLPPGHRRPGWGNRPGWGHRPGWGNRPGWGHNRPDWRNPSVITCYARNRFGHRYYARGFGYPSYIQRRAVATCRSNSRSYCYASGCHRGW